MVGEVDLPENIFNLKINEELVRQSLLAQLGQGRKVLAHTKDRSEVRGGGVKPWRQKGTGRARHGSIRSPLWSGGGVTFGPTKNRNFSLKINKKMKQRALFMVLSSKVRDQQLAVLNNLNLDQTKTKTAKTSLDNLAKQLVDYQWRKSKRDGLLVVLPKKEEKTERAVRNLSFAKTIRADSLNISDILASKFLILTEEAIPVIAKTYSTK